ncbi:MAG TPA: TIGR01777 family oxidoreductase [Solirubrobacteraceae bacterium]|nr:TIGR01777 family oxidoreductase [Solirubrobacteraceae bacterium]
MSRVVVTGATGLIGQAVVHELRARGEEVVALSRDAQRARRQLGADVEVVAWADPLSMPLPESALAGADSVIHLLGEPIAQRWSEEVKRRIRDSRVLGTRNVVAGLLAVPEARRPRVLVSQSAVGYYGPRGQEELTEAAPPGTDFLAGVVKAWEAEAQAAEDMGLRVVLTRTGVVLDARGGALAKMLPPFRAGIGGPVGSGRQYLPWIHLDDVVGALLFCLDHDTASGAVNLSAPSPPTNRDFSRALGRALHRPAFMPVPPVALRLLYGEMAEIVLEGQRAVPARLLELGYGFRHPDLDGALRDALAA